MGRYCNLVYAYKMSAPSHSRKSSMSHDMELAEPTSKPAKPRGSRFTALCPKPPVSPTLSIYITSSGTYFTSSFLTRPQPQSQPQIPVVDWLVEGAMVNWKPGVMTLIGLKVTIKSQSHKAFSDTVGALHQALGG